MTYTNTNIQKKMPFYKYNCKKCNVNRDVFMNMDNYQELGKNQVCECKGKMNRVYTAPQITLGFKEYYDIGLNKTIKNKNEIKEIEKREGKIWGDDKELRQESRLNKKKESNRVSRKEFR